MKLNIRSIYSQASVRILNRLGRGVDFYAAATNRERLCEPQLVIGPAAKVISGQYEKVKKAAFGRPIEDEVKLLKGAPRQISPPTMYQFENVLVAKTRVVTGGAYTIFGEPDNNDWSFSKPDHLESADLVSSFLGCRYFGHWLRDDCATALLFEDSAQRISITTPKWTDSPAYSEAFDLKKSVEVDTVFIDKLVYCDDIYQNSHKAARFKTLRERLRTRIASQDVEKIVYLARGSSGSPRTYVNENEVIQELDRMGVKVLFAEAGDQNKFFSDIMDAKVIISVEGSQLSHALYGLKSKDAGIIVIQPPERVFTSHLDWCRVMGFDFGMVVGNQMGGGYSVSSSDILKTIDLVI